MDCSIKRIPGILLLSVSIFFWQTMDAQKFQKFTYVCDEDTLPYNLLMPLGFDSSKYAQEGQTYPLILFLHGSGERGSDNQIQIIHIKALFQNKENQTKFPAFVLAPQCPADKRWVESHWGVSKHIMPGNPSDPLSATIQLIDKLVAKFPIDTGRIYITGLSMGGFGTWDLICRYPGKFAAAIPICGGGDISKALILKDMPIWAFHGSNDQVVKVKLTRDMINAIRGYGGNPKYTEYSGVGHDSWIKAYKEKELLEWLFKQHLY